MPYNLLCIQAISSFQANTPHLEIPKFFNHQIKDANKSFCKFMKPIVEQNNDIKKDTCIFFSVDHQRHFLGKAAFLHLIILQDNKR